MLKSNFLRYEELRSIRDLKRKIDFFFTEHNEVIPRHQFKGATPREKFLNTWTEIDSEKLKEGLLAAGQKRKSDFKKKSCGVCQSDGRQIEQLGESVRQEFFQDQS